MNNFFLTDSPSDKELYSSMIGKTTDAILESFSNSKAYTGPEPMELKDLIHMDSILPEK